MKNVIFDLDGTLLDTLDDLAASTNYALHACGFPARRVEEVRLMVGNGVGKLIERAVPQGAGEEAVTRCLAVFRRHYTDHCLDRTDTYPGIMPMLGALRQRGIGLAIVSNKLQPAVEELKRRFFASCINVAIGETVQVRRKPAPDMLLQAMSRLNATAADTVYVGDSDVDIQTAKAAGLPCISVTWGFRDRQFLEANGATTLADTPQQIVELSNCEIFKL